MNQLKDVALSGSSQRLWPQAVELIIVAIVYWISVRLGLLVVAHPEGVASIWPASGLALAVLLLSPKNKWTRMLAVIFVTNAAGNWIGGNSFLVSLGFALANTIEPFLGAWVLSYLCTSKISFNRTVEVFALFGVAIFCNGITALLGAAVPAQAFGSPFLLTWRLWWAADGLGIILMTPVIVAWATNRDVLTSLSPRRVVETIVLVAVVTAFAWLLFGPFTVAEKPLLRDYMVFPLLIWLAFRFNQRVMASALFLFATIAIWNTLQGWGCFGFVAQTATEHLTSVQMFLMVTTFSGFLLNAIVSEHKKAVVALRESEEVLKTQRWRLKSIIEGTHIGTWEWNVQTGETVFNEMWAQMIGYTLEELAPISIKTWATFTHPDDFKQSAELLESHFAGELPFYNYECRMKHKDGHWIWVLDRGRVITRTDDGQPLLMFGTHTDITESKKFEEQQRNWEQQRLQIQKVESLKTMAGAIAHHFNNQLGAVMGNLEMALEDLRGDAAPVKILTDAMKAARKAAEISEHMLTYLGQTTGIHAPLDLSETCRHSLSLLQATTPKGLSLKVELLSPGPTIRANSNQIQQVLTNLVTNAWEAVADNEGSVFLTVKMASTVEIAAAHHFPTDWQPQDGISYACLEVADTGCGIAEEDINKLFDPFFSTKFTGRGLGLPVVFGIVKAHHGSVTVESEMGRGSIFRVLLPVSVEELPRQLETVQPLATNGSGTVLLVDDEDLLREMAAARLIRLGYEVIETKNGLEAMEMFRLHQEKICCVLTDLTMPFMDGWELVTAVRKLSPDMPVILSSGYDEDKVKTIFGDHPERPQAFLHKPYQKTELQSALAKAMAS